MNHLRFASSALAAALLSVSSAQAGVIFSFGWSDFSDGSPLTPNLDIGATGSLEARITLDPNVAFTTTSGSADNTWGPNPADAPGINNGRLDFNARDNAVVVFLKNLTAVGVSIDFSDILFDASMANPSGTLRLALAPDASSTDYSATSTFQDFSHPVGSPQSFFLNPGEEKLVLSFTRLGGQPVRLDNIRVDGDATFSAIPEVSSALVFGGLLSSGFLIRRRPRKAGRA